MELRAGSVQDNDGNGELGHGLLETQVAVAGDEYVELFLGQRQQRAVLRFRPNPFSVPRRRNDRSGRGTTAS